jgi:hypothetical protein
VPRLSLRSCLQLCVPMHLKLILSSVYLQNMTLITLCIHTWLPGCRCSNSVGFTNWTDCHMCFQASSYADVVRECLRCVRDGNPGWACTQWCAGGWGGTCWGQTHTACWPALATARLSVVLNMGSRATTQLGPHLAMSMFLTPC